jgi:hypothetical protein
MYARRPRVDVDISPHFRKQLGAVLELAASRCTRRNETVDLFGVSAEQVLSAGPIRAAKFRAPVLGMVEIGLKFESTALALIDRARP